MTRRSRNDSLSVVAALSIGAAHQPHCRYSGQRREPLAPASSRPVWFSVYEGEDEENVYGDGECGHRHPRIHLVQVDARFNSGPPCIRSFVGCTYPDGRPLCAAARVNFSTVCREISSIRRRRSRASSWLARRYCVNRAPNRIL